MLIQLIFFCSLYLAPSYAMEPAADEGESDNSQNAPESLSSSCEIADDDYFATFGFVPTTTKNPNFIELAKIGCNVPSVLCGNQKKHILGLIEQGNFIKLDAHIGRALLFTSPDKVIKMCDNNKEVKMLVKLQNYFKHMPIIYQMNTLDTPFYMDGFMSSYIEMAKGEKTLQDWMQEGAKSFDEKLQIILKLALVINDLHELGVMHGDLKPANILLDKGQILLIDFDQTREFDISAGSDNGTPNYCNYQMSNLMTSAKIDVFSLGLIAYEIFYGRMFFLSADPIESLYLILAKVDDDAKQLILSRLTDDDPNMAAINRLILFMMSDNKLVNIIQEVESLIVKK